MRIAHVTNGVIVNISVAAPDYAGPGIPLDDAQHADIGIGDLYASGVFSKPPKSAAELTREASLADAVAARVAAKAIPLAATLDAATAMQIHNWVESKFPSPQFTNEQQAFFKLIALKLKADLKT